MRRFVLNCRQESIGNAVDTVNAELIRSGTPGARRFVRFGLVSFIRIEGVGMIIEPDSIAQVKFISSGRNLAKLFDKAMNMVLQPNRSKLSRSYSLLVALLRNRFPRPSSSRCGENSRAAASPGGSR
jgi:hypothetical protein